VTYLNLSYLVKFARKNENSKARQNGILKSAPK
jgi:hypothetical protein